MTQQESINSFCNYSQKQFSQIVSIDNSLYQKILLVTAIDALSRACPCDPKPSTKKRFVSFVYDFADWNDKDRVSLVQLSHRLRTYPHVDGQLRNWRDSKTYGIDNDPMPSDLETLATTAERKRIEDCCHVTLLYEYRCNLVHEFREPGHGFERMTRNLPCYHSLANFKAATNHLYDTWELVYPINFFLSLVKSSLHNLREYLSQKGIDPYSFYNFGPLWKHN